MSVNRISRHLSNLYIVRYAERILGPKWNSSRPGSARARLIPQTQLVDRTAQLLHGWQSGRWPETQFQDLPKRIRIAQSLIALERVDPFGGVMSTRTGQP